MQTSNSSQHIRSNRLEWHLLAEYALSEITPHNGKGDELTAGFLSLLFRELGIPPECIENTGMAFAGLAKEALVHFKRGRVELPERIRIFSEKKAMADANSAKASAPYHAEPRKGQAPAIPYPGTKMNGGWGYFIVEQFSDDAGSAERARPLVDLYFHKEAE